MSWDALDSIADYHVQIFSDHCASALVHTSPSLSHPTYTVPDGVLEWDHTYYWRVTTTPASGYCPGDPSACCAITTKHSASCASAFPAPNCGESPTPDTLLMAVSGIQVSNVWLWGAADTSSALKLTGANFDGCFALPQAGPNPSGDTRNNWDLAVPVTDIFYHGGLCPASDATPSDDGIIYYHADRTATGWHVKIRLGITAAEVELIVFEGTVAASGCEGATIDTNVIPVTGPPLACTPGWSLNDLALGGGTVQLFGCP